MVAVLAAVGLFTLGVLSCASENYQFAESSSMLRRKAVTGVAELSDSILS